MGRSKQCVMLFCVLHMKAKPFRGNTSASYPISSLSLLNVLQGPFLIQALSWPPKPGRALTRRCSSSPFFPAEESPLGLLLHHVFQHLTNRTKDFIRAESCSRRCCTEATANRLGWCSGYFVQMGDVRVTMKTSVGARLLLYSSLSKWAYNI